MNEWGPLEIILVLVLAIALLTNIGAKNSVTQKTQTQPNTTALLSDKEKRCGLTVESPVSLEKVAGTIHVAGVVSGCKWNIEGGTALYAQVVDGAGVPVSTFTAVPVGVTTNEITTFNTDISLTKTSKKTGYLILIPAASTKENVSVRIPIRFVVQ